MGTKIRATIESLGNLFDKGEAKILDGELMKFIPIEGSSKAEKICSGKDSLAAKPLVVRSVPLTRR
jgi:hypothetical protein